MPKQTAIIVTYEKEGTDEIKMVKCLDENGNYSHYHFIPHKSLTDYAQDHFDNWSLHKIIGRVQNAYELNWIGGKIVLFTSWV